jgi:hypothetical protein
MSSLNPEVLLLKSTGLTERFNAAMNHLTPESLTTLMQSKVGPVSEIGKLYRSGALVLAAAAVELFVEKRQVATEALGLNAFKDLLRLEVLIDEIHQDGQRPALHAYFDLLPRYQKSGVINDDAREFHDYVSEYLRGLLDELVQDLKFNHSDSGVHKLAKVGEVIAEGPGFEVKTSKAFSNYIEYTEGNQAIMIIHDVRENHFLLVERYNPIEGVFTLEFPRAGSSAGPVAESNLAVVMRDLTGLSMRPMEKIGGPLKPDSHIIKGVCDVYYGNFTLEENHTPTDKSVRSLKRITKDGLYQAAYDGRIGCALTLSAISMYQAFESVRKKRVANSQRVRGGKGGKADAEVEVEADEETTEE